MRRPSIRLAAVVGALALAGVIAGCGDDDNSGGDNGNDAKATKIAMVSWAYFDYQKMEEKGVNRALRESDGGGSVKVFNANYDPQVQAKQCQDVITSGRYNAIILEPVAPPLALPCVKAAKAAGIPVATLEQTVGSDPKRTYDINPQVDGVVAVNTATMEQQVKASAALVSEACGDADPCRGIYEKLSPDDPFSADIIAGVKKALPNVEIVGEFASGGDAALTVKAMPDLLTANRDVDFFLAAADNTAVAAVDVIKEAGRDGQIKVIGNGGSRAGAAAVKAGTLFGTNGNWPEQNGAFVTRALIQAVNGEEVTEPGIDALLIDTPLVITKDNVDEFKPEW